MLLLLRAFLLVVNLLLLPVFKGLVNSKLLTLRTQLITSTDEYLLDLCCIDVRCELETALG